MPCERAEVVFVRCVLRHGLCIHVKGGRQEAGYGKQEMFHVVVTQGAIIRAWRDDVRKVSLFCLRAGPLSVAKVRKKSYFFFCSLFPFTRF